MEKYTMYASVVHKQLNFQPHDSPWEYKVNITRDVIPVFHRLFHQTDSLEFRNFLRSHLPYVPYHYDNDNHQVDLRTMKIYALIHEYTDSKSKKFIEQLPYFR